MKATMNETSPTPVLVYHRRPLYNPLYHCQKRLADWHIILMYLFIFRYVVQDIFLLFGVEPLHLGVAPEPRKLFAGLATGIALHALYGLVKSPCAVEISKHLFISHRIERIVRPLIVE